MKKVIRLTESDLKRIVKRVLNESTTGIELDVIWGPSVILNDVEFPEGSVQLSPSEIQSLKSTIDSMDLRLVEAYQFKKPEIFKKSIVRISVLERSQPPIKNLFEKRIKFLRQTIINFLVDRGVRSEVAPKLVENPVDIFKNQYTSSYSEKEIKKDTLNMRQFTIQCGRYKTTGIPDDNLQPYVDKLREFGQKFDVDEKGIVEVICQMNNFSTLKTLNQKLAYFGGLQEFINYHITAGATDLGDDSAEREQINYCLNTAFRKSNSKSKSSIVRDKIIINWVD